MHFYLCSHAGRGAAQRFAAGKLARRLGKQTANEAVMLCRGLNLSVTAEGVETKAKAKAKAVLEHGVDQAQGFLFGKAVPAAQVPQLFAAPAQMVA